MGLRAMEWAGMDGEMGWNGVAGVLAEVEVYRYTGIYLLDMISIL